jgi:hypothetical protein
MLAWLNPWALPKPPPAAVRAPLALLGVSEAPWSNSANESRSVLSTCASLFAVVITAIAIYNDIHKDISLHVTPQYGRPYPPMSSTNGVFIFFIVIGLLAVVPSVLYTAVQQTNAARKWLTHDCWPLLRTTPVPIDVMTDALYDQ